MALKVFWNIETAFNMQDWMSKKAIAKQCAYALWRNGKVISIVVRF